MVQQRRDRRGREHRPRDGAVRREHLQVLPRLPDGRRTDETTRKRQGGYLIANPPMPRVPAALAAFALVAALAIAPAPLPQPSATLTDPVAMAIATELESLLS